MLHGIDLGAGLEFDSIASIFVMIASQLAFWNNLIKQVLTAWDLRVTQHHAQMHALIECAMCTTLHLPYHTSPLL